MVARGQALFVVNDTANLVMVGALALDRVIDRFNDAVGHPHSKDRQRVPQAAHEQQMPGIPNPFKMKWKHYLPPLIVFRFKVHRSGLPCFRTLKSPCFMPITNTFNRTKIPRRAVSPTPEP